MFIDRYPDDQRFNNATQNYCSLFRSGFVRDHSGVAFIRWEWDLRIAEGIFSPRNVSEIKKFMPISGTIMGLGRLYSIWSTEDNDTSKKELFLHTLTGIIETLGLGIILLIAKIILIVVQKLWEKIRSYCCCSNRYQGLQNRENLKFDSSSSRPLKDITCTSVYRDLSKEGEITTSLTTDFKTLKNSANVVMSELKDLGVKTANSVVSDIASGVATGLSLLEPLSFENNDTSEVSE
ncbi:hypothetical protein O1W69_05115 [Chlamydia sp. 12-01]|uniref:hypothetical protein n=1 Tax=Chlamydia sp. 12-01 TaxID=3002742 RepID=UPI0035D48663